LLRDRLYPRARAQPHSVRGCRSRTGKAPPSARSAWADSTKLHSFRYRHKLKSVLRPLWPTGEKAYGAGAMLSPGLLRNREAEGSGGNARTSRIWKGALRRKSVYFRRAPASNYSDRAISFLWAASG
jgi:hypothetical protein